MSESLGGWLYESGSQSVILSVSQSASYLVSQFAGSVSECTSELMTQSASQSMSYIISQYVNIWENR